MTKPPKKPKPEEIETEPDGWDRFTNAVKKMAPPKPRKAKPAKRRKLKIREVRGSPLSQEGSR